MSNLFTYPGAFHIHTKFSDGTGDINQITKAAKKAGLKWVIITDHNNFDIKEGFYNGICTIKGEEISPDCSDHYLALGIKNCIMPCGTYVQKVREQGGFGYAAHPDESDLRKNSAKPIKWTDKSIVPDGIEIWNWFSNWADNYDSTNIFKTAYGYFFKHNLVKSPHKETLEWWDNLNKEKNIPAIGGIDAHALKISKYIIPVTVFPYIDMFKTIANYFVLKEKMPESFDEQKKIILEQLKYGKNIIINRSVKDTYPLIYIEKNNLKIELNFKAIIRIIKNGNITFETYAKSLTYPVNDKFRVEIYFKNKPWLYTNFFMLG